MTSPGEKNQEEENFEYSYMLYLWFYVSDCCLFNDVSLSVSVLYLALLKLACVCLSLTLSWFGLYKGAYPCGSVCLCWYYTIVCVSVWMSVSAHVIVYMCGCVCLSLSFCVCNILVWTVMCICYFRSPLTGCVKFRLFIYQPTYNSLCVMDLYVYYGKLSADGYGGRVEVFFAHLGFSLKKGSNTLSV